MADLHSPVGMDMHSPIVRCPLADTCNQATPSTHGNKSPTKELELVETPEPTLGNKTAPEPDETPEASLRLAQELQSTELEGLAAPASSDADLSELDEETRQTIELAMKLQEEERLYMQEQMAAAARFAAEPEDEDSIALAIRLQQEDDESALRNAIGADGEDPGSPSEYTYEQLMRLQETVGMVSKGASVQAIEALRTVTLEDARADSSIVLGEQCSICRMEFEGGDELRCLPCGHAEHAECLDQWLAINRSCPLCQADVPHDCAAA